MKYKVFILLIFILLPYRLSFGAGHGFELIRLIIDDTGTPTLVEFDYEKLRSINAMGNYLSRAIISDIDSAVKIWHATNKMPKNLRDTNIYVNYYNMPNFIEIDTLVDRGYLFTLVSNDTRKLIYKKKHRRDLRYGVNVFDVDYALTRDSLVVCVDQYIFSTDQYGNGYKSSKNSLCFIHTYNCSTDEWRLMNIDDRFDRFPDICTRGVIRKRIIESIDQYLDMINRYRIHNHGGRQITDDEYNPIFVKESDLPIGTLYELPHYISVIDRDVYFKNSEYNKFVKKIKRLNKEWEGDGCNDIEISYKLSNDTLIIILHQRHLYTSKNSIGFAVLHVGLFVYKYDCSNGAWVKSDEMIGL